MAHQDEPAVLRRRVEELERSVQRAGEIEQALRDSEEKYRLLFETAPIGLGVADANGNLLAYNKAMLAPGGYSPEDIERIGNVGALYTDPAERERALNAARTQGFVWRHGVRFKRKDGSAYDALLSLTPVTIAGERCWQAVVEDITEQKRAQEHQRQLEEQLRQAQKLEAVGRMTGGIAHDFNNLLLVIMANAEMLAEAIGPEQGDAYHDLADLRAATQRAAVMIRKLLGFSRQEVLQLAVTDLGQLVANVVPMLRHLVPEHVAIEIDAPPGHQARVDSVAVEQMLMNLASNARDAMPEGGTLRMEVQGDCVLAGERDPSRPWMPAGRYVRVSTSDMGTGMEPGVKAKIFEPFFTTKPAGVGTGLGLPMVFGLMKQHRGFVDVESEPGRGTTVHLHFPAVQADVEAVVSGEEGGGIRGGGETVLLIEDEEHVRATTKRVLERLGYHVITAGDGAEGVAAYKAHQEQVDLVITDVVMPRGTGPEVHRAIKAEDPSVPFVFASGWRKGDMPAVGELLPDVPLLRKPWTLDDLARKVREVLDRQG